MGADAFQVYPFSSSREIVVDAGYLAGRRHIVHGLLEVDVTVARQFIRDHKAQTGERLSLTGYVVHCLVAAVEAYPLVQAYRGWRRRLIVFDDVDVVTLIEIERDSVAVPHVIRAAQRKSLREIHDEIRAIQTRTKSSAQASTRQWILNLPRFLRLLLMRIGLKNPHTMKRLAGTVVVTAVGMFGDGHGWGIGFLPMHTLGITLGGIVQRPALLDGELVNREYLCLTVSLDHDIVDGAPGARFVQRFRELLESGYELETIHPQPESISPR